MACIWMMLTCEAARSDVQVSTVPPALDAAAARAVLGDCIARLNDNSRQGVVQQCPQVPEALRRLGDTPLLAAGWEQRLNSLALQDLLDLSLRYQGNPISRAPAPELLAPILHQLREAPATRSWWRQLEDRLRQWLAARNSSDGAWLTQLLSAVPPLAVKVFFYVTLAAVVLMALWTVWRELRASGWLPRRRETAAAPGMPGGLQASVGAEPSLADVQAAPAGKRASVLLRLLLYAMHRAGRVRGEAVLSCRELAERAVFDSPEQRRRFAVIALWAERERYGTDPQIDVGTAAPVQAFAGAAATPLMQAGRELYAQLLQPAVSRGAPAP